MVSRLLVMEGNVASLQRLVGIRDTPPMMGPSALNITPGTMTVRDDFKTLAKASLVTIGLIGIVLHPLLIVLLQMH